MSLHNNNDSVEELAKRLGEITIHFEEQRCTLSLKGCIEFGRSKVLIALAREVKMIEIEARIKQIEECKIDKWEPKNYEVIGDNGKYFVLGSNRAIKHANDEFQFMINELTEQLKTLKGNNGNK